MCFNVCTVSALCDVCWTEAVDMRCVVALCTSTRAQAWWLVTRMWLDHHMHMCHRSQHTDTHTSTQKHKTTHFNMVCVCAVCVCAVPSLAHVHVMTQGVGVSRQCLLHPTIFSHCAHYHLSYLVVLLHLHEYSLITTLTEQLCSHCQQLLWI